MITYTSQPAEADGIDTYINQDTPTTNYGTLVNIPVGLFIGSSLPLRGLLKFDLSKGENPPEPGITVVGSPKITIYCEQYSVARTLALYECLLDWVEGQATWNIWKTGSDWTTGGAGSDGNDYLSAVLGSVAITGTGSYDIDIPASIVQKWIDTQNYGMVLRHTVETTNFNRYSSSDNVTAENRPKLTFDYILSEMSEIAGQIIHYL